MKKLLSVLLGLTILTGTAALTFGYQEEKKGESQEEGKNKKKGKKKKKDGEGEQKKAN